MRNLALLALFCAVVTSPSEAKLAVVNFSELVDASDLIVKARSVSAFESAYGSGGALLEVQEVIFGEYKGKTISLSWSSEVHDQGISEVGRVYILFLRRHEERDYQPAKYGMSYWKIRQDRPGREVVDFTYPITMVKNVPESLLLETRMAVEPWPDNPVDVPTTSIDVAKLLFELRLRKGGRKDRAR